MPQKVTFADDIATSRKSVRRQARRRSLRKDSTPKPILKTPTEQFPDVPDSWYFPIPCLRKRNRSTPIKLLGRNCVEVVHNLMFEQINYYNLDIGKVSNNVTKSQNVAVDRKREQTDSSTTVKRTPQRVTEERNGKKEVKKGVDRSTQPLPKVPLGRTNATSDAKDGKVRKAGSKELNTPVLPKSTGQCLMRDSKERIEKNRASNDRKEHDEKVIKRSAGARLPPIESKTDNRQNGDRTKKEALRRTDLKRDENESKTKIERASSKINGHRDRIDVMNNNRMTTRSIKNDNMQVINGTGKYARKHSKAEVKKTTIVEFNTNELQEGTTFSRAEGRATNVSRISATEGPDDILIITRNVQQQQYLDVDVKTQLKFN